MATKKHTTVEASDLVALKDVTGRELTSSAEVEQALEQIDATTANKPKLQVVRKNTQGKEVAVKPGVKQAPKAKQPKVKAKKARATETVSGHSFVTIEIIMSVFADAQSGMRPAEIAKKYNLAPARSSRILTGSRGFAERMERKAKREGLADWHYPAHPFVYPEPKKETK